MSRLLESAAKALLRQAEVPVPAFEVAESPEAAAEAAARLGCPVALKALVPAGRRGKAGGVRFAQSPEQARAVAQALLGSVVAGYPVESLLVERRLETSGELYASVSIDSQTRWPVVVAGAAGGVDVEQLAREHPALVRTAPVDPFRGLELFRAREIWADLDLSGPALRSAAEALYGLYRAFQRFDATLVEVNPLALTPEGVVAVGALMSVDDDALFRHPELEGVAQPGSDRAWRPLTPLENQAVAVDLADPYRGTARYTEVEGGDIGFICGGGGGSLLMYDALLRHGGRPANYSEVGGNPTEAKMYGLTRVVLSKSGLRGLLVCINITNNTQTDVCAAGIARALRDSGVDVERFPVLVRLAGVGDERARDILLRTGVEYHGEDITMEDAASRIVELVALAGSPRRADADSGG